MLFRNPKTKDNQYKFREMLVTYETENLMVTIRRHNDTKYEVVQMMNDKGILALHCQCGNPNCSHRIIKPSIKECLEEAEQLLASYPEMDDLVETMFNQPKETMH